MSILKKTTIINARKFDNSIHRSWKADLVKRTDKLLFFVGIFEQEIVHPKLGTIKSQTTSYEYYWLDRWYNVFRFHEPDGQFRNYYCNVNMLPTLQNNILNYVDLDIDVLVKKDLTFEVLDINEFKTNSIKYNYPKEIKIKAEDSLSELRSLIKNREFPFDYSI